MSQHKGIDCNEAVARLYDYLDREGPAASMDEVEEHLDICRHCCSRFAFEEALWRAIHDKGQPQKCPESLTRRVQNLLDQY